MLIFVSNIPKRTRNVLTHLRFRIVKIFIAYSKNLLDFIKSKGISVVEVGKESKNFATESAKTTTKDMVKSSTKKESEPQKKEVKKK